MTELPGRDEFTEQIGSVFRLELTPDESIDIKLNAVDEMKEIPPYESFSLVFLAPADCQLAGQIYKLAHEEMGEMEFFLSPFGCDENGLELEAILNVLAKA